MKLIDKYFPDLTTTQKTQLSKLPDLYQTWNAKINVVSRTDLQNLEERHLLHSLAIYKLLSFPAGAKILDLGTGGGSPGIPLAILNPTAQFHLIDGIKKKITVVEAVAKEVLLDNVHAEQKRAEELEQEYDYIVIRAVADIVLLWKYCKNLLTANGVLVCLKGGDIYKEVTKLPVGLKLQISSLDQYYQEEFFKEKFVVTISREDP